MNITPDMWPADTEALRTRITRLEAQSEVRRLQIEYMKARIQAVRDIHPRSWHGELDYCRLCLEEEGAIWPCPTIRALDVSPD